MYRWLAKGCKDWGLGISFKSFENCFWVSGFKGLRYRGLGLGVTP